MTRREGGIIAALIGGVPLFILLATWAVGPVSPLGRGIREYALPILAVEGIVVGLAVLSGMFRSLKLPRFVILFLAGWLAVAWVGALFFAPYQPLSVLLTFAWMLHGLFGLAVAHLIRIGAFDPSALVAALLGGFILYTLALTVFALQVSGPFDWGRGLPGLGNLRRVAAYATAIIALAVVSRGGLAFAAACAGFFIAFWSGTRATMLSVLVAIPATAALFPAARTLRLPATFLLAALIGLAAALVFPVEVAGNGPARVLSPDDAGRFDIWRKSLEAILAAPWLGHGEGQTAFVLPRGAYHAHPHNLLLQCLIAWGVVGTMFVGIIAAKTGFALMSAARVSGRALPFVAATGALLVHSMFDGALYDVAPVFIFAACAGAAIGSNHFDASQSTHDDRR